MNWGWGGAYAERTARVGQKAQITHYNTQIHQSMNKNYLGVPRTNETSKLRPHTNSILGFTKHTSNSSEMQKIQVYRGRKTHHRRRKKSPSKINVVVVFLRLSFKELWRSTNFLESPIWTVSYFLSLLRFRFPLCFCMPLRFCDELLSIFWWFLEVWLRSGVWRRIAHSAGGFFCSYSLLADLYEFSHGSWLGGVELYGD